MSRGKKQNVLLLVLYTIIFSRAYFFKARKAVYLCIFLSCSLKARTIEKAAKNGEKGLAVYLLTVKTSNLTIENRDY